MPWSQGRTRIAPGLLLLILLAASCGGREPAASAPPPKSPLQARSPRGETPYPFTFEWSGNGPDDVVHVSVVDAAERRLLDFDVRGTKAAMPERLADMIRPGETFAWQVSMADDAGEPVRASGWVRCVRGADAVSH